MKPHTNQGQLGFEGGGGGRNGRGGVRSCFQCTRTDLRPKTMSQVYFVRKQMVLGWCLSWRGNVCWGGGYGSEGWVEEA
jgi:hypothetical protein